MKTILAIDTTEKHLPHQNRHNIYMNKEKYLDIHEHSRANYNIENVADETRTTINKQITEYKYACSKPIQPEMSHHIKFCNSTS